MRSHHLVLLLLAYCRAQLFARNAALLNKGGAVTFETTLGLADVRVTLRGYFRRAADKWGKIITEPLTPKSLTQAQKDDFQRRGCKDDLPDTIENIFVCNSVRSLGSSGNGILAYAAPMAWRSGTRGLPYIGRVVVNNNKVHELAHVYGMGTLWGIHGLSRKEGSRCVYEANSEASREYQRLSRCGSSRGIPLHQVGDGSACSHWDENCFDKELGTAQAEADPEPLSRLSVAGMKDLGYAVDFNKADFYSASRMSSSCKCRRRGLREEDAEFEEAVMKPPKSRQLQDAMENVRQYGLDLLRESRASSRSDDFEVVSLTGQDETGHIFHLVVTTDQL